MKSIVTEIQDYLSNCEHQKQLSSNTIRAYKIDAKNFLSFLSQYKLQNEPASKIGKEIIQQFVDNLPEHYAPRKCKRKQHTSLVFTFIPLEIENNRHLHFNFLLL